MKSSFPASCYEYDGKLYDDIPVGEGTSGKKGSQDRMAQSVAQGYEIWKTETRQRWGRQAESGEPLGFVHRHHMYSTRDGMQSLTKPEPILATACAHECILRVLGQLQIAE